MSGRDLDDELAKEAQLVARAKAGDRAAWAELLKPIRVRLLQVFEKRSRSKAEAEDIVQATLLRVYVSLDNFRGESRFYTWAFQIALNIRLNQLRDEAKRAQLLEERGTSSTRPTSVSLTQEEKLINEDFRTKAFDRLDEHDRKLLVPAADDDDDDDETKGPKPGAERVRIHRARKRLEKIVSELDGTEDADG